MSTILINPYRHAVASFNPTSVAGCYVWYDPTDASSFTYSSGAVVSQWNDKSGNGRHISQGTVANQPKRNVTINSIDAVDFDGTDCLNTVDLVTTTTVLTCMVVVQFDNVAAGAGGNVLGPRNAGATFYGASSKASVYAGNVVQGGAIANTTPYVIQYKANGSASEVRINGGTNTLPASAIGASGWRGFTIGGYNLVGDFDGRIGEICVHDSALSLSDINLLGNYLATKYAITWTTAT